MKQLNQILLITLLLFYLNNTLLSQNILSKTILNPFKTNLFIENHGQFDSWLRDSYGDEDVLFVLNNRGKVFLTNSGLIFKLESLEENVDHNENKHRLEDYYINLNWVNSNKNAVIQKHNKTNGYYTFGEENFTGIKAKAYRDVSLKNIYEGIDIYYSIPCIDSGGVKYKIQIQPNADYRLIKMKFHGDFEKPVINKQGDIVLKTPIGDMYDKSPTAYYQETEELIDVKFLQDNKGNIFFDFPNGYDRNKTIIIDPWIVTPTSLTTDNKAYDVDYDDDGNVYVSGGTVPYKLAKYDVNGNFLWTFIQPNGFNPLAYSEFGIVRKTGSIYIGEVDIGYPQVLKIDALGQINFDSTLVSPNNEIWSVIHNPCNGYLLGFGGGTESLENLYVFSDTNLTNINIINSNNATGNCCNDITDAIIDFNGDIYYLSVSGIGGTSPTVNNHLYKITQSNSYVSPAVFDINTGLSFDECGCSSINFYYIGAANILALNSSYLFAYDGKKIKVWDKLSGITLNSVITNNNYTGGLMRSHQGIAVDNCTDLIYLAGYQVVHVYSFDGTSFTHINDITTNLPDEVFDIQVNEARGLLYVSGNGFLSSIPITFCKTMSISSSIDCETGNVTVTPSGGTPPYSYQWSNGSTTSQTTLTPGTHTITVQDGSCIKRTVIDTITVDENTVSVSSSEVIIPNIFSPNNDEVNKVFRVEAPNISSINTKIYNRWGTLLYESDTNDGWNGLTKSGKEVAEGTYYYIIELEYVNCGKPLSNTYKGFISLMR